MTDARQTIAEMAREIGASVPMEVWEKFEADRRIIATAHETASERDKLRLEVRRVRESNAELVDALKSYGRGCYNWVCFCVDMRTEGHESHCVELCNIIHKAEQGDPS